MTHPSEHAAPPYKGFEQELEKYPRIYYHPDHPSFDYYQETPDGIVITPKDHCKIKYIRFECVLTREGATFSEVMENINEKAS